MVACTERSEFAANTIGRHILVREAGLSSDPGVRSCVARHLPAPFTPHPPSLIDQLGRPRSKDPVVAIATRPQAGASGCAMADGERTILPDLRGGWNSRTGPSAVSISMWCSSGWSRSRGMWSSDRYAPLSVLDRSRRELERFVSAGIDDVTRRRIYALPRGRGVLAELIANPVPRAGELGAHRGSYGFPGDIPPTMTFLGAPVIIVGEPLGDFREKAGGEEFSERDEAVQSLAGFAGVASDHARPYTGLKSCHSESRRAMDALDAMMRLARAVGDEIDLEVILGPVAKRGRAVVSTRTLAIEREHDWTGTSG
jgi:hypothetical protein